MQPQADGVNRETGGNLHARGQNTTLTERVRLCCQLHAQGHQSGQAKQHLNRHKQDEHHQQQPGKIARIDHIIGKRHGQKPKIKNTITIHLVT